MTTTKTQVSYRVEYKQVGSPWQIWRHCLTSLREARSAKQYAFVHHYRAVRTRIVKRKVTEVIL